MAVIACGRTKKEEASFIANKGGMYTLEWRIETDTVATYLPTVLDQALLVTSPMEPLPFPWDAFPDDNDSFAKVFTPRRDLKNAKLIYVNVNYSPLEPGDKKPNNPSSPGSQQWEDPLDWSTRYRIEFIRKTEPVRSARNVELHEGGFSGILRAADTDGPLTYTNGQLIREQIEVANSDVVLVAEKNYATVQAILDVHLQYTNTMNDATFYGAAAKHAKFLSIEQGEEFSYRGTSYFNATIKVALYQDREHNTLITIPNADYMVRQTVNVPNVGLVYALTKAVDVNGLFPARPMPLKMTGEAGSEYELPQNINYEYLTEADYSGLGI